MQVSVEDLSTVKKVLHIEIPEEKVGSELNDAYNNLKRTAKVKGFRPGKVPRSVLERLYKKNVNAEVSAKLIQESFEDAIKETELSYLGNPQVAPTELEEKKPYKYDATIEITPEIGDIDFQGLELRKSLYKVTDEAITAQIEMLQKNMTQFEPVEEKRPVRKDDVVVIDFEGFKDGKPFDEAKKTENYLLKVGAGQLTKEVDENLVGMNPEESKEITTRFPKDHPNPKLADVEMTFQILLKDIRKEILPEINDELAKRFGKEGLDELRKEIEKDLKQGYEKRVEQELNEQAFSALIGKNDFEVPDIMVEYELKGIIEEIEQSFAYRNISMEDAGITKEKLSEEYRGTAVNKVKRHLLLGKLIEQENLTLSDEELEAGLTDMAKALNKPFEEVRDHYKQSQEELEYFKHALLEKRATSLIIKTSTIEEVEPD